MFGKLYAQKYLFLLFLFLSLNILTSSAQLTVTPSGTAASLVAKLAGSGVTIVADSLICNTLANGTFVSASRTTTPLAIDSGIILCTGKASQASGAEPPLTSTAFGGAGDPDLTSYLGTTTVSKDGCALIIYFVPKGDTVSFNYQFGSEEYRQSTCGSYDDAFAFFIAGPGISTSYPGVNMALVPGTTVPVAVNTINCDTAGTTSGCTLSNCTAYGSGSPFTSLYTANYGNPYISYRGYTHVLTAKHSVTPCDTYRIKMAIVDAGNDQYDSGVFIEAGSLKTNTYHFDPTAISSLILGTPNSIVKGCPTDSLKIQGEYSLAYPVTLHLSYGGTGVSGVDYSALPDSVVMPAGATFTGFPILGLITPPAGVKTLTIYLTTSSTCGVVDTFNINILDAPSAAIINHDTTVCFGNTVQILTTGTSGLSYSWSPATYLSSTTASEPVSTPFAPIVYTMTATLPGSICPAMIDTMRINLVNMAVSILTHDTTICQKSPVDIMVAGSDSFYYTWTPAAGLNSSGVKDPVATPSVTTTYSLTVTKPGSTCSLLDHITITVIPNDFKIKTIDTFLCSGSTLVLNVSVSPAASTYTYTWSGPNGYYSNLENPVITTATALNAGDYIVTVTNEGLCSLPAIEKIRVFPTPSDTIKAPPIELCQYAPTMPLMVEGYSNLVWYNTAEDTIPNLAAPYPPTDKIGDFIYYTALISLQSNCIGPKEEVDVKVKSCCLGTVTVPSAFTPNGDGKNDVLRILKSADYVVDDFTIFDRWGVVIFHATGENQSWDGTYNGTPVDIGTYYYNATVNCIYSAKNQIQLKGDVTVVR